MRLALRFSLLLTLLAGSAAAQDFCGTVTDEAFMARYDALIAAHAALRVAADTGVIHIPVTFHIQHSGGGPVVDGAWLDACLDATNFWYRDARVRFYRCGEFVSFDEGTEPRYDYRMVNIAMHLDPDGCAYTTGTLVYVNVACARTLENMISHELGHVLGLTHTHGDSNLGTTDELVDGSNCDRAGDRLCDTPADPNLLGQMGAGCTYIGTARDANGMAYVPLTDNIMSYTNSECADSLTPMQITRARAVAAAMSFSCCSLEAPTIGDTAVCRGESIALRAYSSAALIRWYEEREGGMPVGTGPFFTTPPLDSTRTWYVEAVDSCVSRRRPVRVSVLPETQLEVGGIRVFADPGQSKHGYPYANMFTVVGDALFFSYDGGVWGMQKGDTVPHVIASIPVNTSYGQYITVLKDEILISAPGSSRDAVLYNLDPTTERAELIWTRSGTNFSGTIFPVAAETWALFAWKRSDVEMQLWRTDGTVAGTVLLNTIEVDRGTFSVNARPLGDLMFFALGDSSTGQELWRSDGTPEGTQLLADLWPGPTGSNPGGFTEVNGLLYFTAADSSLGRELWVTQGSGTPHQVVDLNPGPGPSNISNIRVIGDRLYFSAAIDGIDHEPYMYDFMGGGLHSLGNINPDSSSYPGGFVSLGHFVYCGANGGDSYGLWKLDPRGQAPPTRVRKIHPPGAGNVNNLTTWKGTLFFSADDGVHGREPWMSDGTEAGTMMIEDLAPGDGKPSYPSPYFLYRDTLMFAALPDASHGILYAIQPPSFESCGGLPVVLSVHSVEGEVRWYENEWSADPVGEGAEWQSPPLEASTVYWAELGVGECRGRRVAVPVDVIAPPPVLRDTAVAPGTDLLLTAVAASGAVEWYADSSATRHIGDGPILPLSVVLTDTTVYARVREDDCVSAVRPLHVFVRTTGMGEEGMRQGAFARDVAVFPQPARDLLELRFAADSGVEELVLLDMLGREPRRLRIAPGTQRLQLPIGTLAPGPYILLLRGQTGQRLLRVMRVP